MKMLLRILHVELTMIFIMILCLSVPACSTESNTPKQGSKTIRVESGTGKDELLKWFRGNMKYASMFDFMKRREEQIDSCMEKKILCKWIIGSEITNSHKGYIVSFENNGFTIDEFPAGSESDYNITNKDIFFKTR
ncbi:MAG TPA: hypothetical protein VEF37_02375 [Thermodesulfovibrionales bacterium]|nr:hypothetical protein [Thermodesulfovibrionales bacterium]